MTRFLVVLIAGRRMRYLVIVFWPAVAMVGAAFAGTWTARSPARSEPRTVAPRRGWHRARTNHAAEELRR